MRNVFLPAVLVASTMAIAPAAHAQSDVGKVVTGVAQALLQQELDRAAYLEAQRTNTIAGYRDYLARFPKGQYVGNAQQQLTKLGASTTTTPPATQTPANTNTTTRSTAAQAEANLGLSRNQRLAIQQQLTQMGYDTRGADGLWGNATRSALTRWQTAQGFTATGYITGPQVERLADQARGTRPAAPNNADAQASDAQMEERLLGLSVAERREIQLRLTVLGYDTRGTDGVFGQNTRRALARWQADHGETQTGYITADQIRTLNSESRG